MRFRHAYVADGTVLATDTIHTWHTDPQGLAKAIAALPHDPPFDVADVWVWSAPDASTDSTPDGVAAATPTPGWPPAVTP